MKWWDRLNRMYRAFGKRLKRRIKEVRKSGVFGAVGVYKSFDGRYCVVVVYDNKSLGSLYEGRICVNGDWELSTDVELRIWDRIFLYPDVIKFVVAVSYIDDVIDEIRNEVLKKYGKRK